MPVPDSKPRPTIAPAPAAPLDRADAPVSGSAALLDSLPIGPEAAEVAGRAARAVARKPKLRHVGRHDVDFEEREPEDDDALAPAPGGDS